MAADADTIERLRHYLRELAPPARALLARELERGVLHGAEIFGADLVLNELRHILREERDAAPRINSAARLVFKPLELCLVDDRADHRHPGRIARVSLDPLWTWIRRDLLPDDAIKLTDEVGRALVAGDKDKAEQLAHVFQDRLVGAIEASFESSAADTKGYRRLVSQIGTSRAYEDAATLKAVLKGRDALANLNSKLPLRIGNLAGGQLDACRTLVETTAERDSDLLLYGLLVVLQRLAAPWQLIRLGILAAGSDTAARVAQTRYGVTVSIVLAEMERMVGELRSNLQSGNGIADGVLLKTIHDSARALRTELELPIDSTWGRALGSLRAQTADLLRSQIESMPGRVRRLLRPRPSNEIAPNSVLDPGDVTETEALIEFVSACRMFAGELAVLEMTQRTYSELKQYLDTGVRPLLDGLRQAGPAERLFRQSQVEAAVRFCGKVFGKDYAALLGRALEVANTTDRKSA
jgi:hypothetical protein